MNQLNRHIASLLLQGDCVMVPGLGGFVAHTQQAQFDNDEQLLIPPKRTLGFNSQLYANDSLLAQSYMEAYDISYPEALRKIEYDVKCLLSELNHNTSCPLPGLGSLSKDSYGRIIFEPSQAGILTPELYGLRPLRPTRLETPVQEQYDNPDNENKDAKNEVMPDTEQTQAPETQTENDPTYPDEPSEYIRIKVAWIRNAVATAAAIIAFFLVAPPITNSTAPQTQLSAISGTISKKALYTQTNYKPIQLITSDSIKAEKPIIPDNDKHGTTKTTKADKNELTAQKNDTTEKNGWCIVLASQVSEKNANLFISMLQQNGHQEAYTFTRRNMLRVVYGNYDSEAQAKDALKLLRKDKNFAQAWVMKK